MLFCKAIEIFKKHMFNLDRSDETIKSYFLQLNLFNKYISEKYNGPVYLEELQLQDIEEYIQALKAKNLSPASRNHTIYIFRSFFNYCFKKQLISRNITLNLETMPNPQKERIFLTSEEACRLISKIPSPIAKLITTTLFYTGLRISECLNLCISDVDLASGIISVRNAKNKKDRQVPIHQDLKFILDKYINVDRKRENSPYLFTTSSTDRVSPDYINKKLKEAIEALGWKKKVTCHTLRHSFASSLVARNVNIVNIQKLLGHSNLATTSIYTHTNMPELQSAINSI